jgi:hypothetical protein
VNCIVWGNQGNQIRNDSSSSPTITYSIVQGGYPGEGNLDADPLFVQQLSYSLAPTSAGNYRLSYGSPAIDSGDNTPVTFITDLDYKPRIVQPTVDRGAYEWQDYSLTVNIVGEGEVTAAPDWPAFTFLDEVELTATPEAGWVFTGWTGDVISPENPLTLTITEDTVITATFITFQIYLPLVVQ